MDSKIQHTYETETNIESGLMVAKGEGSGGERIGSLGLAKAHYYI